MDYKELVLKAKEGNEEALEELIMKFRPCIVKCSTNVYINGYDMEDLIQIGNMSLMKAVDKYDTSKGNFTSYVTSAIKKNFYYLIRGKAKENYAISLHTVINEDGNELQDILIGEDSFEENIMDKEVKKLIEQCIDKLPEEMREIIKVWSNNNRSINEYSKKMGIKYSTLMKRKEKALKILRAYFIELDLL